MADHGFTRRDDPTREQWFLAWSLIPWDLLIPAVFTDEFTNTAGYFPVSTAPASPPESLFASSASPRKKRKLTTVRAAA